MYEDKGTNQSLGSLTVSWRRSVQARIQNVCRCPRQISRGNGFRSLRPAPKHSRVEAHWSSCATCIASAGSMPYLRSQSRNARRPPSNNLHTDCKCQRKRTVDSLNDATLPVSVEESRRSAHYVHGEAY